LKFFENLEMLWNFEFKQKKWPFLQFDWPTRNEVSCEVNSEVQPRKYCPGQSAKSKFPYHLINTCCHLFRLIGLLIAKKKAVYFQIKMFHSHLTDILIGLMSHSHMTLNFHQICHTVKCQLRGTNERSNCNQIGKG
jgi:hypothetical protein